MAISSATVSFDIADMLGNDFDTRRTKVWITTNIPGDTVIDKAGNKIRLGSGNVTLNADGTGSMLVWVPGADANPSSWQTTVHVDYPDRNKAKGRESKSFGPFTITANADLADLVAEMPVQPEYAMQFLNRIDGVTDHGSVSGEVDIDPAVSTHWLEATGATKLILGDGPSGAATRYVSLLVITGAENVTIDGLEDAELTDGSFATLAWVRGTWILAAAGGSGGGEIPVSDTTPPSAITNLTATGGENTLSFSWSARTDAESAVHYRYRYYLTSAGNSGVAWVNTDATTHEVEVTPGAYTVEAYSYSQGGSTTTDTATATVTAPVTPASPIGDDFNAANTSSINGRTTPVGSKSWVTPWETGLGSATIGITGNRTTAVDGAARLLPEASDYRVKCTYNLAIGGALAQVRIYARADSVNAYGGPTSSVQAVMKNGDDPRLQVEIGTTPLGTFGTGFAQTGTFALEVEGGVGRVYVNDVQVGSSFDASAAAGTNAGFSSYTGAYIDNFEVSPL